MAKLAELGWGNGTIYSDADRQLIVSNIKWNSNRYEFSGGRHVYFSVCRAGGGRYKRLSDKQALTGHFLPGAIDIALPYAQGTFEYPSIHLATIGVTLEKLEMLRARFVSDSSPSPLDGSRFYRDPLMEQLIIAAVDQAELRPLTSSFFDHVLALLIHQVTLQEGSTIAKAPGLSPRQLKLAIEFIQHRLAQDVRLQDVARKIDLSVGEFSRRFHVTVGKPPYAYIVESRMREATKLMSGRSLSVSEVSTRVGYSNPSQFARAFQRFSGLAPSKWRNANLV